MGTRSSVSFELVSRCLESSMQNWTSVTSLTIIRGIAEAGWNPTANWVKTYSNSDPEEISPLSIHCAIYSDVTCASVNGKQSFIVTWGWKEKKRIRVISKKGIIRPLVKILKSTYFARWFDTLKSITCSVSLSWPNGVLISLNILKLDLQLLALKIQESNRLKEKMCWTTSHWIIEAHDPSYFYVIVI